MIEVIRKYVKILPIHFSYFVTDEENLLRFDFVRGGSEGSSGVTQDSWIYSHSGQSLHQVGYALHKIL